jgi:hypothetical protein
MQGHSVFETSENTTSQKFVSKPSNLVAPSKPVSIQSNPKKIISSDKSKIKTPSSKKPATAAATSGSAALARLSKPKTASSASSNEPVVPEINNNVQSFIKEKEFMVFAKEVRHMQKYPLSLRLVVESLLCILNIHIDKARCESTEHVFKQLVNKGGLYEKMLAIQFNKEIFDRMRLFRENSMYRPTLLSKTSQVASVLCTWVMSELEEVNSQFNIANPLRLSRESSAQDILKKSTEEDYSSSVI